MFRFDFVRDIPQASATFHQHKERRKYNYIHTSGSLLVQINDTILLKNDASGPTENENDKEISPFLNFRRPKKCMESSEEQFQINAEYAESYGFLWVYNYALSSKYRNKYTGKNVGRRFLSYYHTEVIPFNIFDRFKVLYKECNCHLLG